MDPITAAYAQDDADWTITVTGPDKTLTARAPGIIAARDRADQLAEKLVPEQTRRTVVHLINGSALDFTATYLQARLSKPAADEPQPAETTAKPAEAKKPRKPAAAKPTAAKSTAAKPKRTKPAARRTAKPADTPTAATKDSGSTKGSPQAAAEEAVANPG